MIVFCLFVLSLSLSRSDCFVSWGTPHKTAFRLWEGKQHGEEGDMPTNTIRTTWPLPFQYALRDSGFLRTLIDTSMMFTAVPQVMREHPLALPRFVELTSRVKRIPYGNDNRQVMDFFQHDIHGTRVSRRLIVFFHGGAWGSGFPELYRLVAGPMLDRGRDVCVVGYRTYPDADCEGQMQDLVQALRKLDFMEDWDEITLMGHSSGAHVSALALQRGLLPMVDVFVGLSGVYNIVQHYQHETSRGIERFSPLAKACGNSVAQWRQNSPTLCLQRQSHKQQNSGYPQATLIGHGALDTTVPPRSSVDFAKSLGKATSKDAEVTLRIWPTVAHSDVVVQLMFGGPAQDEVLDWIDEISCSETNAGE